MILRIVQKFLIGVSLILIVYLSLWNAFGEGNNAMRSFFYSVSFFAVFLVMMVRPLADIFFRLKFLRRLVLLRKGLGILSASIIVGFLIGNIIAPESHYISSIFTADYWSLADGSIFAHLGDITGLILLITSNNLSMAVLGKNWKRIQKLAYVYFYSGGIYEAWILESEFALYAMTLVTIAVITAFIINFVRKRRSSNLNNNYNNSFVA